MSAKQLISQLADLQEKSLAAMASDPLPLPVPLRIQVAGERLLLLGASLSHPDPGSSHPEGVTELAARITIELALAIAPPDLPAPDALDHLTGLQQQRLAELLEGQGRRALDLPSEIHLGKAFRHLAAMLGAVAQRLDRARLAAAAADAANSVLFILVQLGVIQDPTSAMTP